MSLNYFQSDEMECRGLASSQNTPSSDQACVHRRMMIMLMYGIFITSHHFRFHCSWKNTYLQNGISTTTSSVVTASHQHIKCCWMNFCLLFWILMFLYSWQILYHHFRLIFWKQFKMHCRIQEHSIESFSVFYAIIIIIMLLQQDYNKWKMIIHFDDEYLAFFLFYMLFRVWMYIHCKLHGCMNQWNVLRWW